MNAPIEARDALALAPRRRAPSTLAHMPAGVALLAAAYAFGMIHDLASLKAVPRVKPALMTAMVGLHVAAFLRLARSSPSLPIPRSLRVASGVLAVGGMLGMLYSIFVEIPLNKAWLRRGHTEELVTSGFYALVRHPGVLWLTMSMFFASLAMRSRRLLLAWPLIVLGDVLHVGFQERFVLPAVFGEAYRDYQRATPFVVPTPASARDFVNDLRAGAHRPEA